MINKTLSRKFFIDKIRQGKIKNVKIFGSSMVPTFFSGQDVEISNEFSLRVGDIAVAIGNKVENFVIHRVVEIDNKNNKVCLQGDNQPACEKTWFALSDIIAVAKPAKTKKEEDCINLVLDIPFNKPKYFNEATIQVWQALAAKNKHTFYFDFNLDFNRQIYSPEKIELYKHAKSEKDVDSFYRYTQICRAIQQKKFGVFRFSFGELTLCDPKNSLAIESTISNHKSSILYPFYLSKLSQIEAIIKKYNGKRANIYLVVNNFNKLMSATIFAKILDEVLHIKPILVDNSTLFEANYNPSFFTSFFSSVVPIAQLNGMGTPTTEYPQIDFEKYVAVFKIAPVSIRRECYYKKCLFCDRHNRDNFSFSCKNIVEKICNLSSQGVHNIEFVDDCLIPGEVKNILQGLDERGVKINWKGTFRFDPALDSEETIKHFSEHGLKMMFLGLESFSQNLLNKMNKGITVDHALNILRLSKKYGIKTSVSLLFNFPEETEDDLTQTLNGIKANLDLVDVFEINDFTFTKNCKIASQNEGLNYFYSASAPTDEKAKIKDEIMQILSENHKLYSFSLRNFSCWHS